MNPLALMAAISKSQRGGENVQQTSREMSLSTEMIKKLFYCNGNQTTGKVVNAKLDDIQRMSGAQIHLPEMLSATGAQMDTAMLTISGTEESILLAQFLVQSNIDMINKEEQIFEQQRDYSRSEGFSFGQNFPPNQQPPFGGGAPPHGFNGPPGFMGHPNMQHRPMMDPNMHSQLMHNQPIGPPECFGPMGPFGPGMRGRGGPFVGRGGPLDNN